MEFQNNLVIFTCNLKHLEQLNSFLARRKYLQITGSWPDVQKCTNRKVIEII